MSYFGLGLPSDLMEEERFKVMSAKDKKQYMRSVLRKILELNKNGVTISQISKAIPHFNRANIWHHLENLVAVREAYELDMGNTAIYFPNGKMVHPLFSDDIHVGEKIYAFFLVVNDFGKSIYVQEKRRDRMGISEVCGGLILPLEAFDSVFSSLKEAREKADQIIKKERSINV